MIAYALVAGAALAGCTSSNAASGDAPATAAVTTTVTASASAAVTPTVKPTPASNLICEQYGLSTVNHGAYTVQNNRWGTDSPQCITVSATGFTVSKETGTNPTTGQPTAYPSVFWGCHYGSCTPAFDPITTSSTRFAQLTTSVAMRYVDGGSWDAAYDICRFDPTARRDGQDTGAEVMVWLNHEGKPQPAGSQVGTVTIAGAQWTVWHGSGGRNVISYVRTTPTTSVTFPVSAFYADAVKRGYASQRWYLTSVQAGFEPWSGGAGLAVTRFSVSG